MSSASSQRVLEGPQRRGRLIALVGDQRLAELQVEALLAPAPTPVAAHLPAQADGVLQLGDRLR